MIDDKQMDTNDRNHCNDETTSEATFDVERFRIAHESDQQWFYRKQFIEAFRFDYSEERLLCLAQCYANTKCLGCKYSEPLRSLLEQLSEKLSHTPTKRPTTQESFNANSKRSAPMSTAIKSNIPTDLALSKSPNFVSFSSPISSKPPVVMSLTESFKQSITDAKSTIYETAETKLTRLRMFVNQLKQSIQATQTRTGNDENDQAIEIIYQTGNQQRLFIDYRPDETTNSLVSHSKTMFTQTFRGKLYIDEVYICSGEGSNKKSCKRHCFQQALHRFLYENFDVKLFLNKDNYQQYELIKITAKEQYEEFGVKENIEKDSFIIPVDHPMANTKMNFVHARDTTTIAGRTARQQSKLEQQYWQQLGRGMPSLTKPRRAQRSISPPPPVPHQTVNEPTTATIEAVSTTPTSVATIIADIEKAAKNQQESMQEKDFAYPFPLLSVDTQINDELSGQQMISSEAMNATNDSTLLTQQRAKLSKMQAFLFSLSNTLADASHSIDLISTQINKYHLQADFECPDKPTPNGFHGHLIIEQVEVASGFGINKKLAKKQAYSNALKSISSAKSFSLEICHEARWTLVCYQDETGLLKAPIVRKPATSRGEDRPSRWGPPTSLSAVTSSTTSAVRHFHERRAEEGFQREKECGTTTGVCIPPPALIEPPLKLADLERDLTKCISSTDESILNNIRRLIPNTFVVFESLDFDESIPGHYVSMLFTSMSKNKLELKYEFIHVPNGFMITYTINSRFFMSWIAPTKVAAKQAGAKRAVELLKTIYPTIKTKQVNSDMFIHECETLAAKCKLITRSILYQQLSITISSATATTNKTLKEDMGSRLLKKMGWIGGGIGKDLQGIAEPIQIEDLQGRRGLGSNNLFPNQIFIQNLRRILEEFISNNDDDSELLFASEFNSEERKTIHKEAMKLHLTSNSYGREGDRRIRVTHKRNVDQLVDHLLTHGGETARYELKVQAQPKSIILPSSQRTHAHMAPEASRSIAPDACDDGIL